MATALLQSLVAIVSVSVLANLLRLSFADVEHFGEDMALVSYTLIMLLGLVLSTSAIRRLVYLHRSAKMTQQATHIHDDEQQSERHDHQHDHGHMAGSCGCKHAHVPDAKQSWLQTLGVVFSVGLRPCSGAILVLIYAHLVGVFHYGVAATLAMGLGTGLSVSIIALGSQYARRWLEKVMTENAGENRIAVNYAIVSISVRLAGGAILLLLGWGLFYFALQSGPAHHFHQPQQAPGWLKEMRGEHVPETEEYGISSFSYLARRPFHPEKFHQFLHNTESYGKLIRSKGYFWLASRPQFAGQWSQAGGIARYGFAGMFWKAVPKENWPTDEDYLASIEKLWIEPFGDMRQELVFIGQGLDQNSVTQALNDCLLTEEELLCGKDYWATLKDPFPAWRFSEDQE